MKNWLFLLSFLVVALSGCSRSATKENAGAWLTTPNEWNLKEVTVNGKPIYQNGKTIEQFGEVSFNRYMETVSFTKDGKFSGTFKGDDKKFVFNWTADENQVTVADTVPNSGKWQIPYLMLTKVSFDMETETTAFDPPNLTKVRLRFVHE